MSDGRSGVARRRRTVTGLRHLMYRSAFWEGWVVGAGAGARDRVGKSSGVGSTGCGEKPRQRGLAKFARRTRIARGTDRTTAI